VKVFRSHSRWHQKWTTCSKNSRHVRTSEASREAPHSSSKKHSVRYNTFSCATGFRCDVIVSSPSAKTHSAKKNQTCSGYGLGVCALTCKRPEIRDNVLLDQRYPAMASKLEGMQKAVIEQGVESNVVSNAACDAVTSAITIVVFFFLQIVDEGRSV
jgi:hypothetical protein